MIEHLQPALTSLRTLWLCLWTFDQMTYAARTCALTRCSRRFMSLVQRTVALEGQTPVAYSRCWSGCMAAHCDATRGEVQVHVTGDGGTGAVAGSCAGGAGCGIHNVSRPLDHVYMYVVVVRCHGGGDTCGKRVSSRSSFNLMGSAPGYEQLGGAYVG